MGDLRCGARQTFEQILALTFSERVPYCTAHVLFLHLLPAAAAHGDVATVRPGPVAQVALEESMSATQRVQRDDRQLL